MNSIVPTNDDCTICTIQRVNRLGFIYFIFVLRLLPTAPLKVEKWEISQHHRKITSKHNTCYRKSIITRLLIFSTYTNTFFLFAFTSFFFFVKGYLEWENNIKLRYYVRRLVSSYFSQSCVSAVRSIIRPFWNVSSLEKLGISESAVSPTILKLCIPKNNIPEKFNSISFARFSNFFEALQNFSNFSEKIAPTENQTLAIFDFTIFCGLLFKWGSNR